MCVKRNKQVPLMPYVVDSPKAKEFEVISAIFDENLKPDHSETCGDSIGAEKRKYFSRFSRQKVIDQAGLRIFHDETE